MVTIRFRNAPPEKAKKMNKYKEAIYRLLDIFVKRMADSQLHSKGLTKEDLLTEEIFYRIGWRKLAEVLYGTLEETMNSWVDDEEYEIANDLLEILEN